MNHAKDSCLKNRIKSAMALTAAAPAGLVNLGDHRAQQAPPAPISPDEDEAGNARIFPQRLYDILSNERNAACIGWLPHGRGFIIKNRKRFAAEVLPVYFKQTKYTSFTRKLNRWDFTRVTRGPEIGAYYHQFFRQGEPTLCTQMYCKNERAKFAAKQQQQVSEPAAPVATASRAHIPVEQPPQQAQPQPSIEPTPVAEPQKAAPAAAQEPQQQPAAPALPKIHPSLLLSPHAKMMFATQMAAQSQMQQSCFNFAQAQQQPQPSASTNAIVDSAVQAMYRSTINTAQGGQPPSDFSIAALQRQQAAIASQMAQARAAVQHQRQQFAAAQQQQLQQQQQAQQHTCSVGSAAAAMPKLPPSQSAAAQARMAQSRRNNAGTKGPSFSRASAA